ncbi:hypothetical protein ACJ6WE_09150 [Streptomyces sp. MMS24-I31]|uniref:hypothetical protein n=1 Tax=Streptomyces sp. MMS24-I31 TaxID=3351563 RepID=UPI003896DC4B
MSDQPHYPHADGDRAVLGPDVYATADGTVIFWQGAKYRRDYGPTTPAEAVSARVSAPQANGGAAEGRDGERGFGGRETLREQIAEALMRWAEGNNDPQYASMRRPEAVRQNAYSRADAVLAVVQPELDQLDALRAVARGYCPACGRGDAAPTITDWEQQRQRAERLAAEVTALRDDLYGVTGARWIADSLDSILNRTATIPPAHDAGPSVRECADADRRWPLEKHGE